jgi:ribose 5-phosphate isomerase B
MKIALGSDHAGLELKEDIKEYLQEEFSEHDIVDMGTHDMTSTSYAIYGAKVGHAVAAGDVERGIIICGSGLGISMTAGKIRGVRAALCHDEYTARMSRLHNDANILAMGGRVIGKGLAREMVKVWLEQEYEGGRHQIRVEQIESLSQGDA